MCVKVCNTKAILPPINAVYICIRPIDIKNILGKPTICTSILVAVYRNITLRNIPIKTPNTLLCLEIVNESNMLEIIIKGIKYTKKRVALPKSKPVPVATKEGVKSTGIDLLKPYLRVEKMIRKLIALPTSSWGCPITSGIRNENRYIV